MFSNVTNQMSSWLGGLSVAKKTSDDPEQVANEQHSELEHSDKEKETQESKTDTPTSQKSVKGSLDEQDDGSSTTEGADSNISSPGGSPSHEPTGAMPDMSGVSEKLNQGAKTFGSFLSSAFNKAGKTVSEAGSKIKKSVAENSMLTEFSKENEAFINSKKSPGDAAAPWVGSADEEVLKEQVLALSTDKRNFVRSPPAGVQFQFELEAFMPQATALLKEDPELEKRRYELVPKAITEETFWRNYFYRVSLIRQSCELSSLAQEGQTGGPDSKDSSRTSSVEAADQAKELREEEETAERPDSPHEFVSDSIQPSSQDLEEVRAGIRQLGMNKKVPAAR